MALPTNFKEAFDLHVKISLEANKKYNSADSFSAMEVEEEYDRLEEENGIKDLDVSYSRGENRCVIMLYPLDESPPSTFINDNISAADRDLLRKLGDYITSTSQVANSPPKGKLIVTPKFKQKKPTTVSSQATQDRGSTTQYFVREDHVGRDTPEDEEWAEQHNAGARQNRQEQDAVDAATEQQNQAARNAPPGAFHSDDEIESYDIKVVDPVSGKTLKISKGLLTATVDGIRPDQEKTLFEGFWIEEKVVLGRPVTNPDQPSPDQLATPENREAASVPTDSPSGGSGAMPLLPGTPLPDGGVQTAEQYMQELQNSSHFYGEGALPNLPSPPPEGLESDPDAPPPPATPSPPIDIKNMLKGSLKGAFKKPSAFTLADSFPDDDEKSKVNMSGNDNDMLVGKEAPPGKKANIDLRGLSYTQLQKAQKPENSGLMNRPRIEPYPDFLPAGGDNVISGVNNNWIILTRDRPGALATGYGPGQGHTQAGAIDIVVGRMSPKPRTYDKQGHTIKASPIFNYAVSPYGDNVCDAARIYVAQKTNVDINFGLADGQIGKKNARSAVAMKADAIRIISRDSGIKLVTMGSALMNSQGGTSASKGGGVDIIAGNDDSDLQPMVLGDRLVELLSLHEYSINSIVGTMQSVITNLALLHTALTTHHHMHPSLSGMPNVPDPGLITVNIPSLFHLAGTDTFSTFAQDWEIIKNNLDYLNYASPLFILSQYNNVN